ncbi:hypothetical protein [Streptomyces olivaceoviridis]|uniref:hypothetical protein n=1 Tax=Streptomyces olivaceoviridis TaxID=1921 RepID=UPI00378E38AC
MSTTHDLGESLVAEDRITQREIEALTRRVEAVEDRVEAMQVQTGGNFAAVIEGQAALRREVRDGFAKVNGRFDALEAKMDQNQAQIVELLTQLVGRRSDAS